MLSSAPLSIFADVVPRLANGQFPVLFAIPDVLQYELMSSGFAPLVSVLNVSERVNCSLIANY